MINKLIELLDYYKEDISETIRVYGKNIRIEDVFEESDISSEFIPEEFKKY